MVIRSLRALLLTLSGLLLLHHSTSWLLSIATDRQVNQDTLVFWSGARLFLEGRDSYNPAIIFELQQTYMPSLSQPIPYFMPPWALIFFSWVGYFDCLLIAKAWMVLNLAALVAAGFLFSRTRSETSLATISIACLITIISYPGTILIVLGQITGIVVFAIFACIYFLRKNNEALAAGCFALASIKPHLALVVYFLLIIHALKSGKWKFLAWTSLLLGVAVLYPLRSHPEIYQRWWASLVSANQFDSIALPVILKHCLNLSEPGSAALRMLVMAVGLLLSLVLYIQPSAIFRNLELSEADKKMIAEARFWRAVLPIGICIGLCTASYAWHSDFILTSLMVGVMFTEEMNRQEVALFSSKRILAYTIFFLLPWLATYLPTMVIGNTLVYPSLPALVSLPYLTICFILDSEKFETDRLC